MNEIVLILSKKLNLRHMQELNLLNVPSKTICIIMKLKSWTFKFLMSRFENNPAGAELHRPNQLNVTDSLMWNKIRCFIQRSVVRTTNCQQNPLNSFRIIRASSTIFYETDKHTTVSDGALRFSFTSEGLMWFVALVLRTVHTVNWSYNSCTDDNLLWDSTRHKLRQRRKNTPS